MSSENSSSDAVPAEPSADSDFAAKRRWVAIFVFIAMVLAELGFWAAAVQPATLPMWAPPQGFWAEFFQPGEINRWQRPQPFVTQKALSSVAFSVDGKTALTVGEEGTLFKSEDAGQSWKLLSIGNEARIQSVAFNPNGKNALAVGVGGTLLRSESANAWQTWLAVPIDSRVRLQSVAFSRDGVTALAVGEVGTVLRSGDSGQSWGTVASEGRTRLQSVTFNLDGTRALAVGDGGTLLTSNDAGKSWQRSAIGNQAGLRSIVFSPDGKAVLAVGQNGTLLISRDAGKSWQTARNSSHAWLNSAVFMPDSKTAFAVGEGATLLKSGDAGESWQSIASGSHAGLRSLTVSPDGKNMLAVGLGGTVLKSGDGGLTWKNVGNGSRVGLYAVVFNPQTKGAIAVGEGGTILKSDDAGKSWQSQTSVGQEGLRSVAFSSDGSTALALGEGGKLLKSEDAGQSWQSASSGTQAWLNSVAFVPKGKTAFAVGKGGALVKSGDAGRTWNTLVTGVQKGLNSVAFNTDGTTVLAVGESGTILRSIDSGETWKSMASGSLAQFFSVAFGQGGKTAMAVGDEGAVFQSWDDGQSWRSVPSGTSAWLYSVGFSPDGKAAVVVGEGGVQLKSVDAGQTWQVPAIRVKAGLNSVAFSADGKVSLAVGEGGTVFKSEDAGESWQTTANYSKSPGAWFYTLLLLLALLAIGSVALQRRQLRLGRQRLDVRGLMSNAVTDKPVEKPGEDRLAFMPVVGALSRFLRHDSTIPSLSIAVNAAWGQGKSSFMNLLAGSLKQYGTHPVHFNVWHHQHEEVLLAPLLQAIVNQAVPGWASWAGWRFRARLWCERCSRGDSAFWWGSLAPLTLPAYGLYLAWRVGGAETANLPLAMVDQAVRDGYNLITMLTSGQWQASVKNGSLWELASAAIFAISSDLGNAFTLLGFVGLVVAWVLLFSYTLRPFPASPAILVASLDKKFSLSKAEAQTDFRQRFRRHFGQVACALQPKTMVVFIDDLDRCKPEKAAELLEAANYLSDAGPCFIILGMAREIVQAQVASAHRVVAEEQAAMARALRKEVLTKDANTDSDRFQYAQQYLRKLVQLDIALPKLDAARSIQLLLGKLGVDAVQTPMQDKKPWISPQARGVVLLWLMLLGSVCLMFWRTMETHKVLNAEREQEVQALKAQTQSYRQNVEAARVYANWLSNLAGDRAATAAPTVSAVDPTTGKPVGSPLLYKARADMMAGVLRDLEAGLAALEHEAPEGQGKTFYKLHKKAFEPVYKVFETYTAGPQIDGREWREIEAGLRPEAKKSVKLAAANTPPDPDRHRTPAMPPPADEGTLWDKNLVVFIAAATGLLLAAIFRAKDNYTVQPTPEYEDAVRVWQVELLRNPQTASPRELKRFMNLSRYAVARLQTATVGEKLPISETCIVELCAKWLSIPESTDDAAKMRILRENGAKKEEVALFLEIVGDVSEGGREAK